MANFTPVGTYIETEFTGAGTIALDNQGIGNVIFLAAPSVDSTANYVTGITGGGATWQQVGTTFHGVVNGAIGTLWAGTVTALGAQTASVAVTGGGPTIAPNGSEFEVPNGWALDKQGNLDSAGTTTWSPLTPAENGEMYFGFAIDSGIAVAGSTPGYTYTVNSHSDGAAWNTNCPAGTATAPVWGDAHQVFGSMVLIKPASAALSGTGDAAVALAASGPGSSARSGGAPAAVALGAASSGSSARSGSAPAALALRALASGSSHRSGTGVAALALAALGTAPAPPAAPSAGSWWGLVSVLRQSRQEFDAYWSYPPTACPVCGEPLKNAPSAKSGSGVELYCNYAGDHEFQYPRDWHPPVRFDSGGAVSPLP